MHNEGIADNVAIGKSSERDSNLELMRIVAMLLIITHHYVVNSGIMTPVLANVTWTRSIFLMFAGGYGKTCINCFVLVTGYFMCTSNITLKKFIKLVGLIQFYRIIFYVVFLCSGYETFSVKGLVFALVPFRSVGHDFAQTYPLMYLFIPFINILIRGLNKKQHLKLIALCGFVYVFFGTIKWFSVEMNYVSWFIAVYFIGAYIRLYPPPPTTHTHTHTSAPPYFGRF